MKFLNSLLLTATTLCLAAPAVAQQHPLDSLTRPEIETTVAVLKREGKFDEKARLPMLVLAEPPKAQVLAWKTGDPLPRRALAVVMDRSRSKVFEAVVDVTAGGKLVSYQEVPGVQPGILVDEFEWPQDLVRQDPRWQAAMRKRGITNFSEVQIDVWAPGLLSEEETRAGRRIIRALSFYRGGATNPYARPIEGVVATVDIHAEKVLEVVDLGVTAPIVDHPSDFDEKSNAPLREAPRPLLFDQPEGPSFNVSGNLVKWQNWQFRVSMDPREGLVLYDVRYDDRGKLRPVAYRMALAEMVVPYGDPAENWVWRNAFDLGEYGVGRLANSLVKGSDVPNNAVLRDAVFVDDYGKAYVQPAAYAIYERDGGILWKHFDFDTGHDESRRARELVLGSVATVGNYDYAFWWVFGQDGTIQVYGELTGIMLAKGVAETKANPTLEKTGRMVAPHIVAPNHQHFFGFRLDLDVDGTRNSVVEVNNQAFPELGKHKNAFGLVSTTFKTEREARRDLNFPTARKWVVVNPNARNAYDGPTGFMLFPQENAVPYLDTDNPIRKRARFLDHHVWVTRYSPTEHHPADYYPNQGVFDQGLVEWSGDEPIENEDVVLWYNFGVTHNPRPEEWPVMPHHKAGFLLLPNGFFDRNPSMDVPNTALPNPPR